MSDHQSHSQRLVKVAGPLFGAGVTALSLVRSSRHAARADDAHVEPPSDASFVELIESVSAATSQARTVPDAMWAALGRICHWTGWPVGHVYLAGDRIADPLQSSTVWHMAHPDRFDAFRHVTEATPMPSGVGLPGRVLASGRPAWIVDVTNDANFPRAAVCEQVGLRGAFSFPVPAAEQIYAIIECFSSEAVTPDMRLLEVAAHIGRQLGRVIQNMETAIALRDSETRFRSVAESANDAIVAADQHGVMISWNRGAERMFGYTEPEVVGKPLSILMPQRFRELHDAGIQRVVEGGVGASRMIGNTVEVIGLRKGGREFPLELSLATWDMPNGRFFSGIIRDISERKKAEDKIRALLETAPDPIVEIDDDGRIALANARTDELFGYERSEIVKRPIEKLFAERSRELVAERFHTMVNGGETTGSLDSGQDIWGRRKDGTEFPVGVTVSTVSTDEGLLITCIIRDVTDHKRERQQADDKIRALLETAPDPIVEIDCDGRVVLANARTDELFGYERSEIVKRPIEKLFAERSRELVAERFHTMINGGEATGSLGFGQDIWGQRKDGNEFPVDVTLSRVSTDEGPVITSIIRDVTERKRFETQLKHLANHDALTELFNRRRFEEELTEYSEFARRYKQNGAVLLLDLDRFKFVNDTHGHKAGDEVIRSVGVALRDSVRQSDVVARLGGDEFAVLLKNVHRAEAERIAITMLETVRGRELPIAGSRATMTTSIGIALFGDDVITENLLVNADLAMYAAKEAGGNRYEVSEGDGEHLSSMQARLGWVDQIRRGLDEDRFVLYCQPILHLASDQVTQWELLLRLTGDDGEMILPAVFIPTAERFGLIQEIDRWVVRHAIELLDIYRDWPGGVRFEVNVSGKSISDPELLALVEDEILSRNVDPANLVFEITETAAIASMEEARAFANRLTALGCHFALDDFGSGFSSFYYLKYLPLNYLKIDGDFIKGITSSVTDQLVVKSIVDIARGMGMKTIAEFVETAETADMLHEKGVDYSQGYYHGRPRPVVEEFAAAPRSARRCLDLERSAP